MYNNNTIMATDVVQSLFIHFEEVFAGTSVTVTMSRSDTISIYILDAQFDIIRDGISAMFNTLYRRSNDGRTFGKTVNSYTGRVQTVDYIIDTFCDWTCKK